MSIMPTGIGKPLAFPRMYQPKTRRDVPKSTQRPQANARPTNCRPNATLPLTGRTSRNTNSNSDTRGQRNFPRTGRPSLSTIKTRVGTTFLRMDFSHMGTLHRHNQQRTHKRNNILLQSHPTDMEIYDGCLDEQEPGLTPTEPGLRPTSTCSPGTEFITPSKH